MTFIFLFVVIVLLCLKTLNIWPHDWNSEIRKQKTEVKEYLYHAYKGNNSIIYLEVRIIIVYFLYSEYGKLYYVVVIILCSMVFSISNDNHKYNNIMVIKCQEYFL